MIHIMPYLISGAVWAATEKNTFYAWKKILFGKNIRYWPRYFSYRLKFCLKYISTGNFWVICKNNILIKAMTIKKLNITHNNKTFLYRGFQL